MNLRIALYLIIGLCTLYSVASAANVTVIHIGQRDSVYYNDTVDLRGITGWADTLAWWATNSDPMQDPPDAFINITKYERYTILNGTKAGMWYQWYGKNEKSPVPVFWVIPRLRPASLMPGAMTPTPTPTPAPQVNLQPNPLADILLARHDVFTYVPTGPVQVWLLGPSLVMLGNRTDNLTLKDITLTAGQYTMILQHPDGNGVFEVYSENGVLNSTWKDVPAVEAPMNAGVLYNRLTGMFSDASHFHGSIEEKKIVIQDQRIDVTNLEQIPGGLIVVSGITNLASGDNIAVIFDENRSFLPEDRAKVTFNGTATGPVLGAYRLWQVVLDVNLQGQPPGNHYISLYTPDGTETTVPFYLQEAFLPFETPAISIKYVNNSPFLPTPTPVIIEKTIPVTVLQTVIVHDTPPYSVVLQAQNESAAAQRRVFENNLLSAGIWSVVLVALAIMGYKGTKYAVSVVRRAKVMG